MKLDALITIGGDGTLAIAHQFCQARHPDRRRPEDHRQRHRRHHELFRLRHGRRVRHRRDRSPAHDGRSASPHHGRRGDGALRGLDCALRGRGRRRRRDPDSGDSVRPRRSSPSGFASATPGRQVQHRGRRRRRAIRRAARSRSSRTASDAHVERLGGIGAQVCAALGELDGEGNAIRRARTPAARRRADQLRSAARDAVRRQGGGAGDGGAVRHDGGLRSPGHRRAAARGRGREDEDGAARFRSDAHGAGARASRSETDRSGGSGESGKSGRGGQERAHDDSRQVVRANGRGARGDRPAVLRARLGARDERQLQRGRVAAAAASGDHGELGAEGHPARVATSSSATSAAASSGGARGKPSAETLLHVEIARRAAPAPSCTRTRFGARCFQSGGSAAGRRGCRIEGYEMLKGLAGVDDARAPRVVPILDNDQDMTRLAGRVGDALAQHPGGARVSAAASRPVHVGRRRWPTPSATSRFSSSCSRRSAARRR